jgi:mannosyltransferase OCH1-like enzyme
MDLARASLLEMNTQTARAELGRFVQSSKSYLVAKGQSINVTQSHVGQLLEEFELDQSVLTALRQTTALPVADQLSILQSIVQSHPDCMSAAIATMIALRKNGRFSGLTDSSDDFRTSPIPSQIIQFWDREPPGDVVKLMTSWQTFNPQYSWTCFSDAEARRFIGQTFPLSVLQAYNRAQQPAQKADVFRLAYLVARGGIYVDADDRCDASIASFTRNDATLVVHQDNYASIGNNFIAAIPEHPVLQRALSMVVTAINRGDQDLIWLSTGPGLLTRAFAAEWAETQDPSWLEDAQVLSLGELQRMIGLHCPVRYKTTDQHWTRKSFPRHKVRMSARGTVDATN